MIAGGAHASWWSFSVLVDLQRDLPLCRSGRFLTSGSRLSVEGGTEGSTAQAVRGASPRPFLARPAPGERARE